MNSERLNKRSTCFVFFIGHLVGFSHPLPAFLSQSGGVSAQPVLRHVAGVKGNEGKSCTRPLLPAWQDAVGGGMGVRSILLPSLKLSMEISTLIKSSSNS